MKALTLTQPWATLVAIGAKKIETRSWKSDYRGPLAIHAAKKFPISAQRLCAIEPFYSILKAAGLFEPFLPLGCIIATCELVDVRQISERKFGIPIFSLDHPRKFIQHVYVPPDEPELSFGDYTIGRYAWILGNVEVLDQPVAIKGMLGLWEWGSPYKWTGW